MFIDNGCKGYICPTPIEQEIEGVPATGYAPILFNDVSRDVIFRFNQSEFLQVLSALVNGAQYTYKEDGLQALWYFLRNVEFPVSACDLVSDAISTCVSVDAAIAALMQLQSSASHAALLEQFRNFGDSQYEKLTPLPGSVVTAPLPGMGGPIGCDLDILFSQCLTIVQMMNRLIEDMFDTIEVLTNPGEVAAAVASGVPVVSVAVQATGANGIIAYALALQDSIRENYAADYDQTYEQEMACLFFCLGNEDCNISLEEMIAAVGARITVQVNVGTVYELFASVIDLNISGINVADIYFFLFLNSLKLANMFLPRAYGVERLFSVIGSVNDPNDDWKTLCTACGWEHTFPDTAAWDAWTLLSFQGAQTVVSNNKLTGVTNTAGTAVFVYARISANAAITSISFDVEFNPSDAAQQFNLFKDGVLAATMNLDGSSPKTLVYSTSSSGNHEWDILGGVVGSTAAGNFLRVTSSTWRGTGVNPF